MSGRFPGAKNIDAFWPGMCLGSLGECRL
ncbi:MAG: hypothetical protein P8130_16020 [Deltaproteobacteria bacterium]